MSVEQINMQAVKDLLPTIKAIIGISAACVFVWYGTKLGCILLDKIIRLFDIGRLQRKER